MAGTDGRAGLLHGRRGVQGEGDLRVRGGHGEGAGGSALAGPGAEEDAPEDGGGGAGRGRAGDAPEEVGELARRRGHFHGILPLFAGGGVLKQRGRQPCAPPAGSVRGNAPSERAPERAPGRAAARPRGAAARRVRAAGRPRAARRTGSGQPARRSGRPHLAAGPKVVVHPAETTEPSTEAASASVFADPVHARVLEPTDADRQREAEGGHSLPDFALGLLEDLFLAGVVFLDVARG